MCVVHAGHTRTSWPPTWCALPVGGGAWSAALSDRSVGGDRSRFFASKQARSDPIDPPTLHVDEKGCPGWGEVDTDPAVPRPGPGAGPGPGPGPDTLSMAEEFQPVVILPVHGSGIIVRLQERFDLIGCATLPCALVLKDVGALKLGIRELKEGTVLATVWQVSSSAGIEAMQLLLRGDASVIAGPILSVELAKVVMTPAPSPPKDSGSSEAGRKKGTGSVPSGPAGQNKDKDAPPPDFGKPKGTQAAAAPPQSVPTASTAVTATTTPGPLVDVAITRKAKGMELSITRRTAPVVVILSRPRKAGGDWLSIATNTASSTATATAQPVTSSALGAAAVVVSEPAQPTYRSTVARAAMRPCLFQGKARAELPYLFHSGRLPWYAALRVG